MVSGVWYVEMYTVGDNSQWSWWLGMCVGLWSCYICTCTSDGTYGMILRIVKAGCHPVAIAQVVEQ